MAGVLPDGTSFDVILDPGLNGKVIAISAAIVVELEDGTSPMVGITRFRAGRATPTSSFENGIYSLPAGDWSVRITVYSDILEALGTGVEAVGARGSLAQDRR